MVVYRFVGSMVMLMGLITGSLALISSQAWENLGISVVQDPVETTGKVIDISHKDIYRAPVIRFQTQDGRYYTFLSQFDRNVDLFHMKKGDQVSVIYEKNNPKKAQENNFWGRYGPRVIPAGFGTLMFLIGLLLFRKKKKAGFA